MLNPPLLTPTASLKERHYFIFHEFGLPTIQDAVTGPHDKLFPAGQLVDVIGHHTASGTYLIRIRDTQYHSWLATKHLLIHDVALKH